MNLALVAITDPANPAQFKGAFSVQFNQTDILNNGTPVSPPASNGFSLTIGGNGALPGCLFYTLWAPGQLSASNNLGCPNSTPVSEESSGGFLPGRPGPVGMLQGELLWDGSVGIFTASFTLPI